MESTESPSSSPPFPSNFLCRSCRTTSWLWPFRPRTCLSQIGPARPLSTPVALFCVCCVYMHPPTPIRTHPHPPESLITRLCLGTHICVLSGNFPAIHAPKTYPPSPFMSLLTLFCCSPVSSNPIAPMQTHVHPYTTVHTRPHPILRWKYVYLCKYNNIDMYICMIFYIFEIILSTWGRIYYW